MNDSKGYNKLLVLFFYVSLGLGTLLFIHGIWLLYKANFEEMGLNEIGDYVGGTAGALWAASGLFLLYLSFLEQKNEIKTQSKRLDEQQSLSSFYTLLNLYVTNISDFDYGTGDSKVTARDCFRKYFEAFQYEYNESQSTTDLKLKNSFEHIMQEYSLDISLFLNSITSIVQYIESLESEKLKTYCYKTLYGQLSNYEIAFIYYQNILNQNFTKFIESNAITEDYFDRMENIVLKIKT